MWSIYNLQLGMEILPHGATTEILQFILKCIQLCCHLRKREKKQKRKTRFEIAYNFLSEENQNCVVGAILL